MLLLSKPHLNVSAYQSCIDYDINTFDNHLNERRIISQDDNWDGANSIHSMPDKVAASTLFEDPRTITFTDSKNRLITTHLFPLLRPTRLVLSPKTSQWTVMSLPEELEIPHVAELIDMLERIIYPNQFPPLPSLSDPVIVVPLGEAPFFDDIRDKDLSLKSPETAAAIKTENSMKQNRREKILMHLRENGYNLAKTAVFLLNRKEEESESLEILAEKLMEEHTVSKNVYKNVNSIINTLRKNSNNHGVKLKAENVSDSKSINILRDRIEMLAERLEKRDSEIKDSNEACKLLINQMSGLRSDLSKARDEARRAKEAENFAKADLENERIKVCDMREELETLRCMHVAKISELHVRMLEEREEHVGRLRFVIGALQNRSERLEDVRRIVVREITVFKEYIGKLKVCYINFWTRNSNFSTRWITKDFE